MSVIIRLQNLPWSANALDIRQYFQGLSIPEGGVHIVGGELGDAFIAFSTDEDARQAMMNDTGKIKEVKVKLLLSSRAEMQKVIEGARQQSLNMQNLMQQSSQQSQPSSQQTPSSAPPAAPTQNSLPHPPSHGHQVTNSSNLHPHMQHAHPNVAGGPHQQGPMQAAGNMNMPMRHPLPPVQNVSAHNSPQQQQSPRIEANRDSQGAGDKTKDSDSRVGGRRNRSRSRSRDRDRKKTSRDKERDRHRGRRGRSRSRSRERRRRDRSRDRSRSRDRERVRDRGNRTSKDSRDGKEKEGPGSTGRGGKSGSGIERKREKSPMSLNGGKAGQQPPSWPNLSGPNAMPLRNDNGVSAGILPPPGGMGGPPARQNMPGNFPPDAAAQNFPYGSQDRPNWGAGRGGGNFPPQGRFGDEPSRGGFRGGPPGRGRPSRFGDQDNREDGNFPHRRGDRPSFEDGFHNRPFNRENSPRRRCPPHTCVELRNIPTNVVYRDIREFFHGMHVQNVKLLNDDHGRRTGVAYIRFFSLDNKEAALTLNGANLAGSVVEILHLEDNLYEEAIDSFQPSAESVVVALRGLPHYANEQDVRRLFPGARLLNVVVMAQQKNPHAPHAFVQFSTMQEGKRAMGASGKLTVDQKEVYVEKCSLESMLNAKKMMQDLEKEKDEEMMDRPKLPQRKISSSPSDCVHLQGLPSNVTNRDILDFFSDVGLVPIRIHIDMSEDNISEIEAYCEFSTTPEGVRALSKNKNLLGTKEITVSSISRRDLEQRMGNGNVRDDEPSGPPNNRPMGHMPPGPGPGMPPGPMAPGGRGGMGHMMHHDPHMRGGMMGHPPGPPMRGHAPGPHGDFMGRGRFHGDMRGGGGPPPMRGFRGMYHGGPMLRGPPPPSHIPPAASEGPTVDKFGAPGCVIELQNVPFKAEIEEIIEYFEGYGVTPANVIRRYNDNGLPTGDARVALQSPSDAQRAMQELKFKKIRDRSIYMSLL